MSFCATNLNNIVSFCASRINVNEKSIIVRVIRIGIQFITPQKTEGEAMSYLIKNINEIKNRNRLIRASIPKIPKELSELISHNENRFIRELTKLRLDIISTSIWQAYKKE